MSYIERLKPHQVALSQPQFLRELNWVGLWGLQICVQVTRKQKIIDRRFITDNKNFF